MSPYNIVSTLFLVLLIGSLSLDGTLNISGIWYIILLLCYVILNIYGVVFLNAGYFLRVRSFGNRNTNSIAITFDDGPIKGKTERILNILRDHNANAAFFCVGYLAKQNREIIKRMTDEGHIVANHSFSHAPFFDLKSASMISKELSDTEIIIQEITGKKPRFFRPPFGLSQPMLARALRRKNCTVVGWSLDASDLRVNDTEKLLHRFTTSLKGGDIIRFHDKNESMLVFLSSFLEHVKKSGLQIIPLDELLNEKAYESTRVA